MLGAMKRLYTVGRNYWIGFIAATRRPARMHTDLRNGADATAFFQIVGTQDRKAMTDYLGEMAEKDVRDEIVAHVAKLPVGTAYFYQPHEKPALQRVHFRYRDTLDTTTTEITAGHKAIKPVLATVDLSELGEAMKAAREKAKADDPKELRKTISELRGQLKRIESAKPQTVTETKTKTEIKTVEKRVVITSDITRLEKLQEDMKVPIERIETLLERAHQERSHIAVALTEARELNAANTIAAVSAVKPASSLRAPQAGYAPPVTHHQVAAQLDRTETNGDGDLAKGPLKLLRSIVQFGRVTRDQLTLLSGYTQSSRDTYLKVLSSQGLVAYPERGEVEATDAGREAAGEVEELPTGQELINWWLARLPSGHARVFQAVVSEDGQPISRQRITELTGYTQSSRDTYIKKLKTRKLIIIPSPGMIAPARFLFQ